MTLSISISDQAEAKLKERAAAEGKEPTAYAAELIEDVVMKPRMEEMLAPLRKQVAESGMTDAQLDGFYEGLRDEVWAERQGRNE
jgi:hypothetical protein